MHLEKASLTYYSEIVLIGDPIVDFYNNLPYPGAALNVYYNLKILNAKTKAFFPDQDYLIYKHPIKKSVFNYYKNINNSFYANTLVCSDYNKGFLKNTNGSIYSNLLIVDSKYNTLCKNIIKNSSIKILKQTFTDAFDWSFINLFDYLIVKNHQKEINIYNKTKEKIFSVTPPVVNSQNDCGAGDVFVAVLSALLHNSFDKQNLTVFTHAVKQAAYWAAHSTTTPFTSNIKDINVHY